MRRISARLVPRLLSDDQKAHHVSVCRELKQQARDDPILISNMKHGCMVMSLRLSNSRRSGSRQIHRGRKKRVKFAAMSSPCWSFFRHPRHCPQGIRTPWSNRQWQVLLWGFEAAEGGHSTQTFRQVEKQQLVSPPRQPAHSHITCCSTILDFQKHYCDSPPPHPPPPYSPELAPCDFLTFLKFWHRYVTDPFTVHINHNFPSFSFTLTNTFPSHSDPVQTTDSLVTVNYGLHRIITAYRNYMPVPVAARSKAQVCGSSPAEIVGSNPTGGMDICLLWVLCVVR